MSKVRIHRPYLVLGLPVVLALVALALFSWGHAGLDPVGADETGPQMSLRAIGIIDCDGDTLPDGDTPVDQPDICIAPFDPADLKAGEFTITVDADVIPDGGYGGFGAEVVGICSTELFRLDDEYGPWTFQLTEEQSVQGTGYSFTTGWPDCAQVDLDADTVPDPQLDWNPRAIDAVNDPDEYGPQGPVSTDPVPPGSAPDGFADPQPDDPDSCVAEVVWPDVSEQFCFASIGVQLGQRQLAGSTQPSFPTFAKSNFSRETDPDGRGTLVELDVHCPAAGLYTVWLTAKDALLDPIVEFGAQYKDISGDSVLVKAVGEEPLDLTPGRDIEPPAPETAAIADTLEINCGGVAGVTPTVGPSPTVSPTPGGPTPTPCPEGLVPAGDGCGTPTATPPPATPGGPAPTAVPGGPTPTPCIGVCPAISLGATGDVVCDDPDNPVKCTVALLPGGEEDTLFTLTLNADVIPDGGYGGFTADLFFGGLAYHQDTCSNEIVWPDELLCLSFDGPGGQRQLRGGTGLFPPLPKSNFVGPLVELEVHCPRLGQFIVTLTAAPSTPLGASYIDLNGASVLLTSPGQQHVDIDGDTIPEPVSAADALLINCFPPEEPGDVNGDGVVNSLDGLWLLWYVAGLRDAVPAPANLDANGDGIVNAIDATLILQFDSGLIRGVGPPGPGDVNDDGVTDSLDGLWALWYLAELLDNVPNLEGLDVDGDGVVNAIDVTLILQLDAGLIESPSLSVAASRAPFLAALRLGKDAVAETDI